MVVLQATLLLSGRGWLKENIAEREAMLFLKTKCLFEPFWIGPGSVFPRLLPESQGCSVHQLRKWFYGIRFVRGFGNRPNTVSESTVSDAELSESFGPHRVLGRELSEFLSAFYLCAKASSPSFFAELTEFAQNSVRLSEFSSPEQHSRNSIPPVS